MKISSRRAIASAISLAAVGALSATVLSSTPAIAGTAKAIQVLQPNPSGAAGTCQTVLFTPVDTFGTVSQAPEQLTVLLDENPNSPTQDVDFCTTDAQVPSELPNYLGGDDVTNGQTRQTYNAGPGVTGNGASSGGTPDAAGNTLQSTEHDPTCCDNNNPDGQDRARYNYTPGSGGVRVGIVGLTPGAAKLQGFFDDGPGGFPFAHAGNYTPDTDETQAPLVNITFTPGGQPESSQAHAAVTKLDVQPADDAGAPGTAQRFTAKLTNANGHTVRGVTPTVQVGTTGPNATATPTCDQSDNAGLSRCSFTGVTPGNDTLTVFVNRSGGTSGLDAGEPSKSITRTTTKPATAASEARYATLTPRNSTMTVGQSATFTVTISDINGAPSQGVSVVFTETGPGSFNGGVSTVSGTTDSTGRAFAQVVTTTGDVGSQQITASISTANTQCSQQAGAGTGSTSTTPAGRCTDTVTNTITAASPSPSPSTSTSPSPTPTASGGRTALSLRTSTPDIQPNETGILDATGQPNAAVELQCYSRPSTTYVTARAISLTSSGATQFRITPGANTRCYVRYAGDDTTASNSVVINVHTTLSLSAVRNTGVRNYTFQGRNLPRRSGQLITLYRIDNNGNEIRTSNLTTDSSGIYRVQRHFTGAGTFTFIVRTSQTLNNANGVSNPFRITIR
jgi:hypothetical protein